jgi:hypothetical protein
VPPLGWINLAHALHNIHHCAWQPHLLCCICHLTYGNGSRLNNVISIAAHAGLSVPLVAILRATVSTCHVILQRRYVKLRTSPTDFFPFLLFLNLSSLLCVLPLRSVGQDAPAAKRRGDSHMASTKLRQSDNPTSTGSWNRNTSFATRSSLCLGPLLQ